MTRFYARLTILLIPLFTLLAITMSVLGGTQPIHPALRGFVEGCEGVPQPCWYGIVPGVTTWQATVEILTSVGYEIDPNRLDMPLTEGQVVTYVNGTCSVMLLLFNPVTVGYSCPNLQLGDVLEFTDMPIGVNICTSGRGFVGGHIYCATDALFFRNGITATTSSLMMFAVVNEVRFSTPSNFSISHGWRGFVPHRLYCNLENIEEQYCEYWFSP